MLVEPSLINGTKKHDGTEPLPWRHIKCVFQMLTTTKFHKFPDTLREKIKEPTAPEWTLLGDSAKHMRKHAKSKKLKTHSVERRSVVAGMIQKSTGKDFPKASSGKPSLMFFVEG
jgi:hypothetical protein